MKLIKQFLLGSTFLLSIATAQAGPIIIAGTDADDHGSVSQGENLNGWKFLQQGITNIGNAVTNAQKNAVCIGCNGGRASSAFSSAFDLSGLAGWTSTQLTSAADITNFFTGTGTVNLSNAGMIYMPTVDGNVSGGITDGQLGIVNGNGTVINSYLAAGGGLFAQEQANSSIGYVWLTSLLSTLQVFGDNIGGVSNSNTLQLTAQGKAQFPALTDADISNATPWHAYFTGGFGALQTLVVGDGDNIGGLNDAVVIGGGFTRNGGGGVIICGLPNTPPCSTDIPEPDSLPLMLLALGGLAWASLRKAKKAKAV